jgi:starch phosphorylase
LTRTIIPNIFRGNFGYNLTSKTNAVSKLHGEVAQKMWKSLWPDILTKEIPIGYVTNGIHQASWISREMSELFDRYLGPEWFREPDSATTWNKIDKIPDSEFWRTHERRRERLVAYARRELSGSIPTRQTPAYDFPG